MERNSVVLSSQKLSAAAAWGCTFLCEVHIWTEFNQSYGYRIDRSYSSEIPMCRLNFSFILSHRLAVFCFFLTWFPFIRAVCMRQKAVWEQSTVLVLCEIGACVNYDSWLMRAAAALSSSEIISCPARHLLWHTQEVAESNVLWNSGLLLTFKPHLTSPRSLQGASLGWK